jgi:hypothetical protein
VLEPPGGSDRTRGASDFGPQWTRDLHCSIGPLRATDQRTCAGLSRARQREDEGSDPGEAAEGRRWLHAFIGKYSRRVARTPPNAPATIPGGPPIAPSAPPRVDPSPSAPIAASSLPLVTLRSSSFPAFTPPQSRNLHGRSAVYRYDQRQLVHLLNRELAPAR